MIAQQKKTDLYMHICFYEWDKILPSLYLIVFQWFAVKKNGKTCPSGSWWKMYHTLFAFESIQTRHSMLTEHGLACLVDRSIHTTWVPFMSFYHHKSLLTNELQWLNDFIFLVKIIRMQTTWTTNLTVHTFKSYSL